MKNLKKVLKHRFNLDDGALANTRDQLATVKSRLKANKKDVSKHSGTLGAYALRQKKRLERLAIVQEEESDDDGEVMQPPIPLPDIDM
jgi:hypothetical protein